MNSVSYFLIILIKIYIDENAATGIIMGQMAASNSAKKKPFLTWEKKTIMATIK